MDLLVSLVERHREHERRADRRAGEVAALMANINRDTKKRREPFTWLDIFPEYKEPEKPQTDEQMLAAMQMWALVSKRSN